MLGPNPSLLREKLGTLSSLSIVCYCARSGVYGKPVSQLFLPISMWVFSCSPNVQESSEGILLERIFSRVAVDSVCLWEEVCSASSEVAMLDQNSPSLYFFAGKKRIEIFLCLVTWNRTNKRFIFLIY